MEYKLISFDMDGTLLQSDKTLSKEVIEAIHKASSNGKEIIISTGRCLPELSEVFNHLPEVRYLLVCNGSLVIDWKTKTIIYSNPIQVELVEQMLSCVENKPIMAQILDYKCVLEKNKVDIAEQYGMGAFKSNYYEIGTLVKHLPSYFQQNKTCIQKMNFYHLSQEDRNSTIESFKNLDLTIKKGNETYIECTAKNVNKGDSFIKLCEYLNISLKQTIAVGDSFNDLEILNVAGLSICMDNGNEFVKEACDIIVSDNDNNGCVEAVENFLL